MKRVDSTSCAVVNQDVSGSVTGGNISEQADSVTFKNDLRTYKKRFLWASPTCWTAVIQSTKLRPAWHWWPRPQAPGQPPRHWTPSLYAGCPYQPGRGEGKVMNDSGLVFALLYVRIGVTYNTTRPKARNQYWNAFHSYSICWGIDVYCMYFRSALWHNRAAVPEVKTIWSTS